MACLKEIKTDYVWRCATVQGGFTDSMLGVYTEALLINQSDIESFTNADPANVTIDLATGKKGWRVEGAGRSGISVTLAKTGGALFPSAYDPSVKITVRAKALTGSNLDNFLGAEVVIGLKGTNGITIFGLGAPLSCTEIEGDSTSSEFLTVTFGVEEGQTGSTMYSMSAAAYEALKTPAV